MIGIVGAGITGLALSHELCKLGVDHVVLEAEPQPGGVIRTYGRGERALEAGPQRARLTAQVAVLVDELALRDRLVLADPGLPLFVYRGGRLRQVPFTAGAAVRTDLLSWRGKLRALLEPLAAGAGPDETVASFVTRKFGREVYEALIGPLYGGLYASDPADMPVRHSLGRALDELGVDRSLLLALLRRRPAARGAPPACSFRDGMQTLTDALHRSAADRVRLGMPVRALHETARGIALETERDTVMVEEVVLTVPADAAASMLRPLAPAAADRLARLRYNPLAVVHLESAARLRGLGYQVAFGERFRTRGVTWNASLFGRDGIHTAYLGGARDPEVVALEDDEIGRIAADEFRAVMGHEARVLRVGRTRMPAWDHSWSALEDLRLPERVRLSANYESRAGVPGRLTEAARLARELAGAAGR